jgi:hypothetical protein
MIDFWLCRKCEHCGAWEPPTESEDGDMIVTPSITCDLTGDVLLMNSKPPKECPYALEHKLSTQDVPMAFANYMSIGGRRREVDF